MVTLALGFLKCIYALFLNGKIFYTQSGKKVKFSTASTEEVYSISETALFIFF